MSSTFGHNLKKWRETNNLHIREIANTIGLTQKEYQDIENGNKKYDDIDLVTGIIQKLYEKFNIGINLLFGIDKDGYLSSKLNSLYFWINSVDRVVEHNLSVGLEIEVAVRSFLNEFVPSKYGIEKGFLESLENPNLKRKELDIIFTQNDFGTPIGAYHDFKIFPYEAVLGVMGVTKTLSTKKIKDEFDDYRELSQLEKRQVEISGNILLEIYKNNVKFIKEIIEKVDKYSDISKVPIYYREILPEELKHKSLEEILTQLKLKLQKKDMEIIKLENTPKLLNTRFEHHYGNMPLRFYYFAYNIETAEETFIKNINKYRGKIPIHGMFILKRRIFITSMGKEKAEVVARGEKSYPQFIYSILDGLNNHYHIEKGWNIRINQYLELVDNKYRDNKQEK